MLLGSTMVQINVKYTCICPPHSILHSKTTLNAISSCKAPNLANSDANKLITGEGTL